MHFICFFEIVVILWLLTAQLCVLSSMEICFHLTAFFFPRKITYLLKFWQSIFTTGVSSNE